MKKDRKTERQKDRKTERQRDRKTERQRAINKKYFFAEIWRKENKESFINVEFTKVEFNQCRIFLMQRLTKVEFHKGRF